MGTVRALCLTHTKLMERDIQKLEELERVLPLHDQSRDTCVISHMISA